MTNLAAIQSKVINLSARIDTLAALVGTGGTGGGGGIHLFTSAAPTGMVANDLRINPNSGNVLEVYNGTAWVPYPVGTAAIANAAVTGTDIASATITGTNIATGTISGTNLANNTITATQIANATITSTQISGTAGITGSQIGSATITGSNLVTGTITATQIANATITATQIAGSAGITGAQIGNATVTGANLAIGTITATNIANATITGAQIATGAITASNITNATITNLQIASGSITGSNIGSSTITASNIQNATITSVQIANGTITTTQISNSASITGTQIASGTITASNIAANTITATQIAAGAITSSQIAANTINAGNIATGTIVAGIVDGTTITGGQIVATGSAGQLLIYAGTPANGNMIGAWTGADFTDAYGNFAPAGLSFGQGSISGIGIDGVDITNSTFQGAILDGSSVTNPNVNGGTFNEPAITFDQGGGLVLSYGPATATTVTQTVNGTYSFTVPAGVYSLSVECWGAGAGGDGGMTSQGGNGGGGGQYAKHLNYPVTPGQVITYVVGNGGNGGTTGGGHGTDGGDTYFDGVNGVYAFGGSGNGAGGTGIQGTYTTRHDGGTGGGSGVNPGGGSGGNSGSLAAVGNNGITATGSTGAARPAAQTGAGQGGAGGSSGSNGGNASAPGAGGGGAGQGTTSTSQTKTYAPLWCASYIGPDGSPANGLRSTATMYQGGETSGGGSANGNMRSVFAFNRTQIASDFSGYTVTSCKLQLKNQHSWYNSGMSVIIDEYTGLPGSAPGSFPGGYSRSPASTTFAEGQEKSVTLAASVGQRFVSSTSNGLGIGEPVASSHAWDLNYYGYFDPGQVRFTITGTSGAAGSVSAGDGADGQVKITYSSGTQLINALAPAAGSDANTNGYASGYTGPISTFQPGSSPQVVETWHNFTGITGAGTFTGTARYKLTSDNCVRVQVIGSFSTNGTASSAAIPPAYWPTTTFNFPTIAANVANRAQLTSAGVLAIIVPSATAVSFCQDVPLD